MIITERLNGRMSRLPDFAADTRALAIRNKSIFELEDRGSVADGGIAWVLSRAVPPLDEQGEIAEWFGAGRDITARKPAEEALYSELNLVASWLGLA